MSQIIEPVNEIDDEIDEIIAEWLEEKYIDQDVFELLYNVAVKKDLKLTYKSFMESLDTKGIDMDYELYILWFIITELDETLTEALDYDLSEIDFYPEWGLGAFTETPYGVFRHYNED